MTEMLKHECHADASPVLPALRELLSEYTQVATCSAEKLCELRWEHRYLPRQPTKHKVDAALETLRVEEEGVA